MFRATLDKVKRIWDRLFSTGSQHGILYKKRLHSPRMHSKTTTGPFLQSAKSHRLIEWCLGKTFSIYQEDKLRVDHVVVNTLQIYARAITKNPTLVFFNDEFGRTHCQIFPDPGGWSLESLHPISDTVIA
jgi:hypothetical protein